MKYPKFVCLIGFIIISIASISYGQQNSVLFEELGSATLDGTQSYALKATNIDQIFKIDVAMPMQPVEEGKLLPVVYVLDGDYMFGTAASTSKVMQLGRDVPQMIVVGIGYYFEGLDGWDKAIKIGDARMRDLTPSLDPTLPVGGGASEFLDFLNKEVKTFIESRYPVDTQDQTIMGHSLSGLFVLQTFFNSSNSFHRYIAGSPSLWWNKSEIFKDEEIKAKTINESSVNFNWRIGRGYRTL